MGNTPEYSRAYALTHQKAIRERKRLYYLKNREKLLAAQTIRNRKRLALRRAQRASTKPIKEPVRGLRPSLDSGSRDSAEVDGQHSLAIFEHGGALYDVSHNGSPDGAEKDGRLSVDVPSTSTEDTGETDE